jgi:hypothetical protein
VFFQLLPVEVRERYIISRVKAVTAVDDEVQFRKTAKEHERRLLYEITTAEDLHALLQFATESSSAGGGCSEEELSSLSQGIWRLYSRDADGNGWAEFVSEDHSDALEGGGGNHIRAVSAGTCSMDSTR